MMKNQTIPGLLLAVSIWGATANAAQSDIACDRECLRGKVTQLLYAFVKHDVSKLPVSDKLTEVELVATRSAAEGLIFNIDGLSAPGEKMNYAPRPAQLSTRDEAIKAALRYPAGLNAARTFADVNAPFAAGAYRKRASSPAMNVWASSGCAWPGESRQKLRPMSVQKRRPRRPFLWAGPAL